MISRSNTAVRLAAFALLAFALGGCSGHQQSDAQSTAAPVSQPAAAQPVASAAPDAATQPATATTVAAAAPNAGVASGDGDQTGTNLVVGALVRGSDTLTLKFTLVNDSATPLLVGSRFDAPGYNAGRGRAMSGVHLIDTVSKKKYFPIADTDGNCICSQDVDDIAPKSSASLWVKFPAPPASVTKISVQVPHFIPLDDVPIAP